MENFVPALFLLVVAFILATFFGFFKKVPNGKIIKGEIVSIERHRFQSHSTTSNTTYHAWVEYVVDNRTYTWHSPYASSDFYVGKKVRMMYNTENPEDATIKPSIGTYIWIFAVLSGAIYFFIQTIMSVL